MNFNDLENFFSEPNVDNLATEFLETPLPPSINPTINITNPELETLDLNSLMLDFNSSLPFHSPFIVKLSTPELLALHSPFYESAISPLVYDDQNFDFFYSNNEMNNNEMNIDTTSLFNEFGLNRFGLNVAIENNLETVEPSLKLKPLKIDTKGKTKEVMFQCPYKGCEKQYTRPYNLKSHYRSAHTNERPYECSFCELKFA